MHRVCVCFPSSFFGFFLFALNSVRTYPYTVSNSFNLIFKFNYISVPPVPHVYIILYHTRTTVICIVFKINNLKIKHIVFNLGKCTTNKFRRTNLIDASIKHFPTFFSFSNGISEQISILKASKLIIFAIAQCIMALN